MSRSFDDRLIAKSMSGLEEVLENELKKLGVKHTQVFRRAVAFRGDKELIYRANYTCRTAISIYKPIKHFFIRNQEDLYNILSTFQWENHMNIDQTFAIESMISGELFSHSLYASQLTKDAVVDYFRDKFNQRPSVSVENPDIIFAIRISGDVCTLFLDTSGDSLYKRSYRLKHGSANLNEVLAAGMIMLSGWHGQCDFFDPMCGSGTLAIEAALISQNIPAGYYRKHFGFMNHMDFDKDLWQKVKDEEDGKIVESECDIYASDISDIALDDAKANAKNAKLHHDIYFQRAAFEQLAFPEKDGIIIMNPPYDERIRLSNARDFYTKIGDHLKNNCKGYSAWIILPGKENMKYIGLRPSKRSTLYNGPIECTYAKFEIFAGRRKEFLKDREN
ncbi:MAG: THUMP domain-containing class I SAM-dependent RNA methyltransferase [Bacteroidales bacterium]|jgi:putative N6-adenine-specific DNA methylase|nr:class I SAM-dependent RNA methyltransferase [Bacteroidales bacterium]